MIPLCQYPLRHFLTGCQAELARTQGKQEAAYKRLSRLIHNQRLSPKWLAESVAHQALSQVPPFGKVRFTIDWTAPDKDIVGIFDGLAGSVGKLVKGVDGDGKMSLDEGNTR